MRLAGTREFVVTSKKEQKTLTEHDIAIASSLAVADVDEFSSAVDVGNVQ